MKQGPKHLARVKDDRDDLDDPHLPCIQAHVIPHALAFQGVQSTLRPRIAFKALIASQDSGQ